MREEEASITAAMIAQATVVCAAEPDLAGLVPDEAARLAAIFTHRLSRPRLLKIVTSTKAPLLRRAYFLGDELLAGGFIVHFMVRKHYIQAEVQRAVNEGARQLVVIGAGFDTLALRLARSQPQLRCIEIDHPASHQLKMTILDEAKEPIPSNFSAVAADLSVRPLAQVLTEVAAFVPTEPTVVVAEGLLMYLPDSAVSGLFRAVAAVCKAPVTTVFTYMEHPKTKRHERVGRWYPFLDLWLRSLGEPYIWGIAPDQLSGFMHGLGYQLVGNTSSPQIAKDLLPKAAGRRSYKVPTAEFLAVARCTPGELAATR